MSLDESSSGVRAGQAGQRNRGWSRARWLVLSSVLLVSTASGGATLEQTAILALDQADARRESRLAGYSVTEHYTLRGSRFALSAEMTVETVYQRGQGKVYRVVSRSGSPALQSRVFDRLLREEGEMSRGDARLRTLVNSENYLVRLAGEEMVAGEMCYVLDLTPRVKSTHLLKGRAWIEKKDGSLLQIEGRPTASPSFLTGRPAISRKYERVDEFWLARSSHALSESFFSGTTELSIEYRDYRILDDIAGR